MRKVALLLFFGIFIIFSCKTKVIERSVTINEKKEINYIPYYLKVNQAKSLDMIVINPKK